MGSLCCSNLPQSEDAWSDALHSKQHRDVKSVATKALQSWDKSLISNYDTFLLDCDGVLWTNKQPIDGVANTLSHLQSLKKNLIFITNNNETIPQTYINKIFNFFNIEIDEKCMFTAAVATVAYLESLANPIANNITPHTTFPKKFTFDKKKDKILFIGSETLYKMITNLGINVLWTGDKNIFPKLKDTTNETNITDIIEMKLDPNVKAVVLGYDKQFTLNDANLACRYLHEIPECICIGTNEDHTYIAQSKPNKVTLPHSGGIMAFIKSFLPENKEMVIVGKPNKLLFDLIVGKHEYINPKRTIMIGDRLNTDVMFGKAAGVDTILVFSGCTSENELKNSEIKPDFTLPSIKSLV